MSNDNLRTVVKEFKMSRILYLFLFKILTLVLTVTVLHISLLGTETSARQRIFYRSNNHLLNFRFSLYFIKYNVSSICYDKRFFFFCLFVVNTL